MQKKKTAIVTARMTPEVKHQLQTRAHDANMTLTSYLIICGLGQEIVRIDGLDNLLSELKAQGRNLNQLTTSAMRGVIDYVEQEKNALGRCETGHRSQLHSTIRVRRDADDQGTFPQTRRDAVRPLRPVLLCG